MDIQAPFDECIEQPKLHWNWTETALKLHWNLPWISIQFACSIDFSYFVEVVTALKLLWNCSRTAPKLGFQDGTKCEYNYFGKCSESALKLLWNRTETTFHQFGNQVGTKNVFNSKWTPNWKAICCKIAPKLHWNCTETFFKWTAGVKLSQNLFNLALNLIHSNQTPNIRTVRRKIAPKLHWNCTEIALKWLKKTYFSFYFNFQF